MKLKQGEKHDGLVHEDFKEADAKEPSINGTIQKVRVLTPHSFTIGDTTKYEPYVGKGIAKQLRTKVLIEQKPWSECFAKNMDELPLDMNLAFCDFEKMAHPKAEHICFRALSQFQADKKRMPRPWNLEDAMAFVEIAKKLATDLKMEAEDLSDDGITIKLFYVFPM